MIFPEILGKDFVDEVIGIVFVHFNFFEDDAAFSGNVFGGEGGMQDEVGENLECDGNVLIEHFDVEADTFFGGEGVHVAADGIDLAGDLLGSAVLGAFEDHVLDEVGDAVRLRSFVAGTGFEPNADRGGADVLHLLSDYGEAVRQYLATDVANFFYHDLVLIVEVARRCSTILTYLAGVGEICKNKTVSCLESAGCGNVARLCNSPLNHMLGLLHTTEAGRVHRGVL